MSRDRRYRLPRERVYFPRSLTIFTIAARYARNTVKGDVTPRCIMPRQKAAVRAYSRNYSCQLLFLERPSSPARLRALASLKLEFMGRGLTAATLALTIDLFWPGCREPSSSDNKGLLEASLCAPRIGRFDGRTSRSRARRREEVRKSRCPVANTASVEINFRGRFRNTDGTGKSAC